MSKKSPEKRQKSRGNDDDDDHDHDDDDDHVLIPAIVFYLGSLIIQVAVMAVRDIAREIV